MVAVAKGATFQFALTSQLLPTIARQTAKPQREGQGAGQNIWRRNPPGWHPCRRSLHEQLCFGNFIRSAFLVVSEVAGAVSGVACFGLPPWKKFSAADSRSSHSAQEDGCSSLPCRGVLSFRSGAREASGSETPRVHNVARWCGGVAGRGARPANRAGDWLYQRRVAKRIRP